MAIEKNITMKQFNGTDYDTLYPKTIASQIPDVYSKIDTITAETLSRLGLSADKLPNDAFQQIKTLIDNVQSSADSKARIQTGSYVGTGTYGVDNPCSLTFDFEPKICVVYCYSGLQVGSGGSGWGIPSFLWLSRQTSAKISEGSGTNASTLHLEQNGNTLSWYATAAAGGVTLQNTQCNASGVTYYWLAI